jgi:hypothetical protein
VNIAGRLSDWTSVSFNNVRSLQIIKNIIGSNAGFDMNIFKHSSTRPVRLLLTIFTRPDLTSGSRDQIFQNEKNKNQDISIDATIHVRTGNMFYDKHIFLVKFKRKHCFC